jgi:type III secretion system (T3SS) SseB-like protein
MLSGMTLGDLDESDVDEETAWLFVPARRPIGPAEQVYARMQRLRDGRLAMLAYTSLPALVDACGEHQTWVSFPAAWLSRLADDHTFDTVAINLPVPPRARITPDETNWPGKPEEWDE